jgi:hypothetical protein
MSELARTPERFEPPVNAWFFKETTLAELLAGARPIESVDDLALNDLTPEEAAAFLRSIRE